MVAVGAVVLLVACGAPEATKLPSRPPIPTGWVVLASNLNDVRVALPSEEKSAVPNGLPSSVYAQIPPDRQGRFHGPVITADSPRGTEPQPQPPLTYERVAAWLLTQTEVKSRDVDGISSVRLPAGDAIELRFTQGRGSRDELVAAAYAIRTPAGVGFLVIAIPRADLAGYIDVLRLAPLLIEFGPTPGP